MNFNPTELNSFLTIVFKLSMVLFCLLHALFVIYVARQVINLKDLLSTLRLKALIIFAFVHAIILLALLLYICFLPQL